MTMTDPDTLTLTDIAHLARTLMRENGLDGQWTFVWDNARTRLGQCRYGKKEIGLSRPVFALPENRHLARNTILHEVAHALTPGAHHGPVWRRKALELGCKPDRCTSLVAKVDAPWTGTCGCGSIHSKHRMTAGRTWTCKRCRQVVTWARTRRP